MVRTLLATTAMAAVLATGALAQTTTTAPAEQPAMGAAPAAGTMAPAGGMESDTAAAPATADIAYVQSLGADQHLVTDLDGQTVYASNAADAETAGEIENFIVSADGTIVAAVVDTGSYLGDQSKTVAIPYDKIEWATGENNEPRAVLTATREELAAAPAFAVNEQAAAATGTMAPGATGAMAPAATGDMAANNTAAGGMAAETTAPAATTDMAANTTTPAGTASTATGVSGEYVATLANDQFLTGDIVGDNVYSGPADDADNIGNINDLVIASNGQVEAFVVGVGGFLGIGEKNVGVPFDNISMNATPDGEPRAVLAASKEQLTNAPAFEGRDDQMAANTTATGAGTMGAAGTTATGMAAGTAGMAAGTAAGTTDMAATTAAPAAGGMAATNNETTASTTGTAPAANVGTPVTGADLTADNLIGTSVYGPDNQTIGSIGDIALTPEGQVDAVIVDVGGFLGIGAKPVAVAMDNLQFMRDSGGSLTLTTQFTQDQLRNAPEFNRDTYAENRDQMRVANPGDVPAAPAAQ
ncbi:PRC-barrel domain-containing protein [Aureimonas sp. SK2]|uniref:PRC-barrel domain-containing protein n=1 Tax=Aureimonas sp. SK2 TaxID=3015992 RepID=UPI002444CB0F|nr:PRC-barrel domain-containing protein [Aureimonas sp. SK2]